MNTIENIGPILKNLRAVRKLSIKDVAKSIGITGAYIRYIESGKKYPTLEMLYKICQYYKISLSDLFKLCEYGLGSPFDKPILDLKKFSQLEKKYGLNLACE